MYCKYCGSKIDDDCIVCPHCGKHIGKVKNNETYEEVYVSQTKKSKVACGILAILLGDLGVQYFYMDKIFSGILCILFSWTGIPALIGLIQGIIILCGSDEDFENRFR